MDYRNLIQKQRKFFRSGSTRSLSFRKRQLRRIYRWIETHEREIERALFLDMGKSPSEAFMTEISIVKEEIRYSLAHLDNWARPRRTGVSLAQFPGRAFSLPRPRGVVLVMAPWNYPFQLSLVPLVSALAAGNCAVVKPSAYAPHTSHIIRCMADALFPPCYVAVAEGGRKENEGLLEEHFDYIFFTGSIPVGKLVMEKASAHLTPVSLELGGKSPCIVDETANLKLAARRIVWGKFLNAGQTCVAPDYLLVQKKVKKKLLHLIEKEIHRMYGEHPLESEDYPRIVNEKHFRRLARLFGSGQAVCGGRMDKNRLKIEPTVLDQVSWDSPVMREEIFGPVLPVLTFYDMEEVVRMLSPLPSPLALYLFTGRKERVEELLQSVTSGGVCINDTVIQLASSRLPFGGVGNSGMGACHGKAGFDTFSHYQSILDKCIRVDNPLRYPPYRSWKEKILKKVL